MADHNERSLVATKDDLEQTVTDDVLSWKRPKTEGVYWTCDESLKQAPSNLHLLTNLWFVHLYRCGIERISGVFDHVPALGILDLSHNVLTDLQELIRGLQHMVVLDLRVYGNAFQSSTGEILDDSTVRINAVRNLPRTWCLDGHFIFCQERALASAVHSLPIDIVPDVEGIPYDSPHVESLNRRAQYLWSKFAPDASVSLLSDLRRLEFLLTDFFPDYLQLRSCWRHIVLPHTNGKPSADDPGPEVHPQLSELEDYSPLYLHRLAALVFHGIVLQLNIPDVEATLRHCLAACQGSKGKDPLPVSLWVRELFTHYPPFIRAAILFRMCKRLESSHPEFAKTIKSFFHPPRIREDSEAFLAELCRRQAETVRQLIEELHRATVESDDQRSEPEVSNMFQTARFYLAHLATESPLELTRSSFLLWFTLPYVDRSRPSSIKQEAGRTSTVAKRTTPSVTKELERIKKQVKPKWVRKKAPSVPGPGEDGIQHDEEADEEFLISGWSLIHSMRSTSVPGSRRPHSASTASDINHMRQSPSKMREPAQSNHVPQHHSRPSTARGSEDAALLMSAEAMTQVRNIEQLSSSSRPSTASRRSQLSPSRRPSNTESAVDIRSDSAMSSLASSYPQSRAVSRLSTPAPSKKRQEPAMDEREPVTQPEVRSPRVTQSLDAWYHFVDRFSLLLPPDLDVHDRHPVRPGAQTARTRPASSFFTQVVQKLQTGERHWVQTRSIPLDMAQTVLDIPDMKKAKVQAQSYSRSLTAYQAYTSEKKRWFPINSTKSPF
jgi:hypothetical protein